MSYKAEVVISGIGGIFPNCLDLNDFKDILLENRNTAELAKWIPSDSDDNTIYNNFPRNRDRLFDATFFGLHGNQVNHLDPMTRMLIEKTFEAVIDAGVNPIELRGKNIPVLVGATLSETDASLFDHMCNPFAITGRSRSMIANRVSYWLNVNGASVTMDSNWTSGIQVMQTAMVMVESGSCDAAIVGASIFSENESVHNLMAERGLISKGGLTRPFDEKADGYSRGDGVVVLFLQRADMAKRNYASLLYASNIFNGNHEGDFVNCDPDKLYDFLQQCYATSGLDPKHISYLETYGCGLKKIDEAELWAVERVFCKDRKTPLPIGSVKTNIGHAEPASSLMSLVKIIVAMETGIIPAHLNYDQPNKNIAGLTNGKLEIVTKNKEWSGDLAAINGFGLGCSYGHMIIRRNKQPKADIKIDLPLLLTYSTRTDEGIQKITKNVQSQTPDLSYHSLVHELFSSNIPGHLFRGYCMKASTDKTSTQNYPGNKPTIWFLYSGMGSQWQTMGRDLMKLPIFAEAVYKCHNILKPKGIDLLQIITEDDPQIFENILNSFVGIAAVQIGLTDVLNAIGIQPDGIIGHSVGELGCAYADKCLTAEQMILSAYYRGKASLDADLMVGMMAAVGMGYSDLVNLCPPTIDIACHNSANSCTISGPVDDVTKFVQILQGKDIFAKCVNVSNIAYHSRYIKPAAPLLLSYLKDVIPEPKARSSKWVCTSVPQSHWNTELTRTVSPEYLTNNLLSSVLFEEGLPFIPNNAVAIEIAPHGLLQAILKRALPAEVVNVPLTKRGTNCLEYFFNSLGQLYLNGLDFNLNPLYPPVPWPVPAGTPSLCSLIQWAHGDDWELLKSDGNYNPTERTFDIDLKAKEFEQLSNYKINNRIFIPPVMYFGFIIDMINANKKVRNITFEDVVFKKHIEISPQSTASVTILITPGTGQFEVSNEKNTIVTGTVIKNIKEKVTPAQVVNYKDIQQITGHNFYNELSIKGYRFQNEYELVSSLNLKENGLEARSSCINDWKALISVLFQTHLFYTSSSSSNNLLPKFIQRVNISFDNLEDTGKETAIWFNSKANIIESKNKGIHMNGIKYESLIRVNTEYDTTKIIKETPETCKTNIYNSFMRAVNSNTLTNICRVNNVGLHTADLTRIDDDSIPCKVGALDFSGTNYSGDRIMGFAQTDLEHCKLTTDPAFVWLVPQSWTLCDAATVPYAYTLAYYTLFTLGGISKGDVVLIHAGCSEVGQAALNVAFNYGCTVFTTVANEQQKIVLKKLMPGICDNNILNSETTHFELAILEETNGAGVDLVLNCLPGQRFHISKHFLTLFGKFIQLGTADLDEHSTMGSKMFLTSRSFYGVTGQQLMRLDPEVKRQLYEKVSQGIKETVVVPIRRKIITENRIDDSLRYLRSSAAMGAAVMQINHVNEVTKRCEPRVQDKDCYLIYVLAHPQDTWITLIEWLVRNGAKRILIAYPSNQNQGFIKRFLSYIKQNYDVELIITKHNANTIENAKALAKEVSSYGPIKDIFIFATNSDKYHYNIFKNIDIAFSQNKQNGRMVCILGTNKENSYMTANRLPVRNIMWDNSYNLEDIIQNFDGILSKGDNLNIFLTKESIENKTIKKDTAEDISMLLPNSLKILKLLGQNEMKSTNVVQLQSGTPKKLRGLPPVFLVPGLSGPHCPDLKHFVEQLLFPVFCINLPGTTLQDDIVLHLAQQILKVQQCKVYTLIGVSWGGILAIEIAKYLEKIGNKVKLELINTDMTGIQDVTNHFSKTGVFNTTLLKQVITIDGKKLDNILTSTDQAEVDNKDIVKSLSVLKNLIEYSNFYKPLPYQLNCATTLILPDTAKESDSLNKHCKHIEYKIIKGNCSTYLQNKSVINFVNENFD